MKHTPFFLGAFTLCILFLGIAEGFFAPIIECRAPSHDPMNFYYDVSKMHGAMYEEDMPDCPPDMDFTL